MKEKALLVVSFGTAYEETRKKTIEAVEQELAASFPDYEMYRAWTSGRIVSKLKKEKGLQIDLLEEALQRLETDGKKELLIQPTYIIKGIEYERMISCVEEYAPHFASVKLGVPLLSSEEDYAYMAKTIPGLFPEVGEKDALLLMGHGSPGGDNTCYHRINELFMENKAANFKIGLVEGDLEITELIEELEAVRPEKIYLAPFMLVAGNHALEDMTGDSKSSWLHLLEQEGYEVSCRIQGLGEYEEIRRLFVQHAKKAD